MQYNAVVLSWLTNTLAKELQRCAAHVETAREAWEDLEQRFAQSITPRVYELKRAIALLQQEKSSISAYYGKLKSTWDKLQSLNPIPFFLNKKIKIYKQSTKGVQSIYKKCYLNLIPLCTCGCKCGAAKQIQSIREEEKVFDFLTGFYNVYSIVRSQILNVDPLANLVRVYAIAAQEEKQQSVAAILTPTSEGAALLARKNELKQKKSDHGSRNQFLLCVHCGETNHSKEYCFKVINYPIRLA